MESERFPDRLETLISRQQLEARIKRYARPLESCSQDAHGASVHDVVGNHLDRFPVAHACAWV